MPPEGPNKSEELLKRYAKERREQAPNLSLHPATRRLLQGEVTRQFGKPGAAEKGGWSMWLSVMRGRLAIGTALCAVAVTGLCLWWNNQNSQAPRPMEMAKNDAAAELAPALQPADAEVKLKVKKESWAADALSTDQVETGRRRLPENLLAEKDLGVPASSSLRAVPAEKRAMAAYDAPASSNTLALLADSSFEQGAGLARTAAPNRTDLVVAYGLPGAAPAPTAPAVVATAPPAPPQEYYFAKEAAKSLGKPAEGAQLAGGPTLTRALNENGAERSRRRGAEPQLPPPPAAVATALTLEDAAGDKRQQMAAPQARSALAGQSVVRTESEQLARSSGPQAPGAETVAQRRVLRNLERTEVQSPVLNQFVIEQQGTTVRVVDADGSVYDGKVEEPIIAELDADADEKQKNDGLAREKQVAIRGAIAPRTDGYSFRASGSNVTLRQMVVVNGRFAATPNTAAGFGATALGGVSTSPVNSPAAPGKSGVALNRTNGAQRPGFAGRYDYTTNQSATIEGTVRIGATNQQWFRAVRSAR
jgi:hypothetical protein